MSWVARKLCGSDNEDVKLIQEEYFKMKEKERITKEQEIKKFWEEYGDEYYTGGER